MPTWETVRRQVAIAGRVTDALTGRPISGARLSITSLDFSLDVSTVADGHFHLMDCPDGAYAIDAAFPEAGSRYGRMRVQAIVARDAGGRIAMASADLALNPTTIKGIVTRQGGTPVTMAEISLRGSGELTFSDREGNYSLCGVETGDRLVQVLAQGFKPVSQTVKLVKAGDTATIDFILDVS